MAIVPDNERCVACGHSTTPGPRTWISRCRECGLWRSRADDGPSGPSRELLDEREREAGLEPLRRANFERVLDVLDRLDRLDELAGLARVPTLSRGDLLEVGCGHGWFLEAAALRGYRVEGIEPDPAIAERARRSGHAVRSGLFPACVDETARWDLVVFNDVFEHLPDPKGAAAACAALLRPGGRLVLNLPTSSGFLFRIANRLAVVGWDGALERLWQRGFPSPHLFYFDRRTLERLLRPAGFEPVWSGPLPTLRLAGLWARLRMDRTTSTLGSVLRYAALAALYPFLRWVAPSDILLLVCRKSLVVAGNASPARDVGGTPGDEPVETAPHRAGGS